MKKALIIIPALAAIFFGCTVFETVVGSGDLVEVQMSYADFNALEIMAPYEVTVIPGSEHSITIMVDDNIVDQVHIFQTDQVLSMDLNSYTMYSNMTLKAVITMPTLTGLDLSGASLVTVIDSASLPPVSSLTIGVTDASYLLLGSIVAETISINVEKAGQATITASAVTASISVANASLLRMNGSTTDLSLEVANASSANLKDFKASDVSTTVSGASQVWVNVDGTLKPDITGASSLYYHGSASFVEPNITDASSIIQY